MNKKLKFLTIILSLFFVSITYLSIILPIKPVIADNYDFLRIIDTQTPFYSDKKLLNVLFYLPYTYYVKVLNNDGKIVHAEVSSDNLIAIDGYIKYEQLYSDGLSVTNPYPNVTAVSAVTTTLYQDEELLIPIQYIFPSRSMEVYGTFYENPKEICYYVSYNGKLGYVKESEILPFEIKNHPNPLTFLKEDINTENQTTNSSSSESAVTTLRIIIIGCLILAGIISLVFALKKKPQKGVNTSYFDENDFE